MKLFALLLLTVVGCAHFENPQNKHTVEKGETIPRISHRYQIDFQELADLNPSLESHAHSPNQPEINLSKPRGPLKASYGESFQSERGSHLFIWPVKGVVSSEYGRRWGTFHNGIDIRAPFGSKIKAVRSGKVIHSGHEPGYGNTVIIYHGRGFSTVYAHASKLLVTKGMRIQRGEPIARIGSTGRSTGPHLHFEIRRFEEPQNPINYLP